LKVIKVAELVGYFLGAATFFVANRP